jgi:sugar phosphate isomerase/epimerase
MLKTRYDLNDQDKQLGHQRVYDQESLLQDVVSAGYNIVEIGGFNLKLVSQKQMKDWSQELIRAIFEITRECLPDICSTLYVVCKK